MFKHKYFMVAQVKTHDNKKATDTFEATIKGRMTMEVIREIENILKKEHDLKRVTIINYIRL